MQILYSGAGARTYPFSHYYIHEDGRTFSSSKHTRAIQPDDKEEKCKLPLYFAQMVFFLLLATTKKGSFVHLPNCKYHLDLTI